MSLPSRAPALLAGGCCLVALAGCSPATATPAPTVSTPAAPTVSGPSVPTMPPPTAAPSPTASPTQSGPASGTATYSNERYGYSCLVPAQGKRSESGNAEGVTVKRADGKVVVRCWASEWADGVQADYDSTVMGFAEDGVKVTHQNLKGNTFTVTGTLDGKVIYERGVYDGGFSYGFRWEYPVKEKATYDRLVEQAAAAFEVP